MRVLAAVSMACLLGACGNSTAPQAGKPAAPKKVKITQFYAPQTHVARGLQGQVCYGVENAKRLELNPPVEEVWPAVTRCFNVSPTQDTTYTLTAYGEDGSSDSKSVKIGSSAPPPRLYDLWVNKVDIAKGEEVKLCFKTENTVSVKVSAGKLDPAAGCIFDHPAKTTVYKITALGRDREMDSGTVTVKVH